MAIPVAVAEPLDGAHTVGGDDAVDVAERQKREVLNALHGEYVATVIIHFTLAIFQPFKTKLKCVRNFTQCPICDRLFSCKHLRIFPGSIPICPAKLFAEEPSISKNVSIRSNIVFALIVWNFYITPVKCKYSRNILNSHGYCLVFASEITNKRT